MYYLSDIPSVYSLKIIQMVEPVAGADAVCPVAHARLSGANFTSWFFYADMYARHDLIMESACLWLEDVISILWCKNSGAGPDGAALPPGMPLPPGHFTPLLSNIYDMKISYIWIDSHRYR